MILMNENAILREKVEVILVILSERDFKGNQLPGVIIVETPLYRLENSTF